MGKIHVGVSQPSDNYAANMKKISKGKKQAIPMEQGNNGAVHTSKGKADVGDGSYATGYMKSK